MEITELKLRPFNLLLNLDHILGVIILSLNILSLTFLSRSVLKNYPTKCSNTIL